LTAIELAARAKVRQLVVSHHEPAYSDTEIEEIHQGALRYCEEYNKELSQGKPATNFPEHIKVAFDGLVIEA
jgi:ribonuclease BN (tRNA processing enzyme)